MKTSIKTSLVAIALFASTAFAYDYTPAIDASASVGTGAQGIASFGTNQGAIVTSGSQMTTLSVGYADSSNYRDPSAVAGGFSTTQGSAYSASIGGYGTQGSAEYLGGSSVKVTDTSVSQPSRESRHALPQDKAEGTVDVGTVAGGVAYTGKSGISLTVSQASTATFSKAKADADQGRFGGSTGSASGKSWSDGSATGFNLSAGYAGGAGFAGYDGSSSAVARDITWSSYAPR
jgi:hypothetical protein